MADNKRSFILYCDQRGIFNKLSDEQAGKLIKHIYAYVNDENPESDFVTELAFESIKTALKRDLMKYEERSERARENGSKGGRPPKQTVIEETQKTKSVISKPKKADSDSVSDNDSVTVSDKDKLITWIDTHAARVNRMKEPLTNDEAAKLRSEFDKDYLKEQFEAMHNYEPLIKKSVSTYKTFKSWARRNGHYKTWLKNKPTVETKDAEYSRVFMETVEDYNTHKTLYGEESANEKFFENGNLILNHVRPNINHNRLA